MFAKLMSALVAMLVIATAWLFVFLAVSPEYNSKKIDVNAEYRAKVERAVYVRESTHAALHEREYLVCVMNNITYSTEIACK